MNWTRTSIGAFLVMVAALNASLCLRGFLQGWFGVSWWQYSIFLASIALLFGGLLTFSESRWSVASVAVVLLIALGWLLSWAFGNHFWNRYPAGGLGLLTVVLVGGLAFSFPRLNILLAAAGGIGLLIIDARDLLALFAVRTSKSMSPFGVADVNRTLFYLSMLWVLDVLCLVFCIALVKNQTADKRVPTSDRHPVTGS
jgi:hypothetical protein